MAAGRQENPVVLTRSGAFSAPAGTRSSSYPHLGFDREPFVAGVRPGKSASPSCRGPGGQGENYGNLPCLSRGCDGQAARRVVLSVASRQAQPVSTEGVSPSVPRKMPGMEYLDRVPQSAILLFGIQLERNAAYQSFKQRFPGAQHLSLDGGLKKNLKGKKRGQRTWQAIEDLKKAQPQVILVVQNYRYLKLLALTASGAIVLVYRAGRITPFGLLGAAIPMERTLRARAQNGARRLLSTVLKPKVPEPIGAGNDYSFIKRRVKTDSPASWHLKLSVVIPVYNRKAVLDKTLAGLCLQTYPKDLFEVIVSDDGSSDNPNSVIDRYRDRLNIRYVCQEDLGFRAAKARNRAILAADGEVIVCLDCDMLPPPGYLAAMARWFHVYDGPLAVIGYRKFVNTDDVNADEILADFGVVHRLPPVPAPLAIRVRDRPYEDWRVASTEKSEGLKTHRVPYSVCASGNVAFGRQLALDAGLFDEAFCQWGGEDMAFAYQLYRRGAYFVYEPRADAYHQDHPDYARRAESQKASRRMLGRRVPFWRKFVEDREGPFEGPKVSVYIPAYNCDAWLVRTIESALCQTLEDLEVCVCNDGSTDRTQEVLETHYGSHPRVRFVTQENQGIAAASRAAVDLCRGEYILQLDSDDELLPYAAETLAAVLDSDVSIALAYGGFEIHDPGGLLYEKKESVPQAFDSFDLLLGCVTSAPRMFRARDYYRTEGFDRSLLNAVDYDIYLKLAEQGRVQAVPEVLYRYYVHGQNTSFRERATQFKNHRKVVENALKRRGLDWEITVPDPSRPRGLRLHPPGGLFRSALTHLAFMVAESK